MSLIMFPFGVELNANTFSVAGLSEANVPTVVHVVPSLSDIDTSLGLRVPSA